MCGRNRAELRPAAPCERPGCAPGSRWLVRPQQYDGVCAKSTWELFETAAARVMPVQTVQVLAQLPSLGCRSSLVDSRDASHASTIRHILVPVPKGSQKPSSAVTPCYFCLWCLQWFPEEEFANTGPISNVFTSAEYHYLTLLAFPFTSVGPFAKQRYLTRVKTSRSG